MGVPVTIHTGPRCGRASTAYAEGAAPNKTIAGASFRSPPRFVAVNLIVQDPCTQLAYATRRDYDVHALRASGSAFVDGALARGCVS